MQFAELILHNSVFIVTDDSTDFSGPFFGTTL